MKQTPIWPKHNKLEAHLVDFAGYEMPLYYTSIVKEHQFVRDRAGLFDVSHMGEITCCGQDAQDALGALVPFDLSQLQVGQSRYFPLLNQNGGVIDDVILFKKAMDSFLLVVNAINCERDYAWLQENIQGDISLRNVTEEITLLALQGPLAENILLSLGINTKPLYFNHFLETNWKQFDLMISRTGYTGEDGFELFLPWSQGSDFWDILIDAGGDNLKPIGLGARDTLRMEAGYSLYGHELQEDLTPFDSGIGWTIQKDKRDFIGLKRSSLWSTLPFLLEGKGVPRQNMAVISGDGLKIGQITSGSFFPTLKKGGGILRIERAYDWKNKALYIEIRGQHVPIKCSNKPLYTSKLRRKEK